MVCRSKVLSFIWIYFQKWLKYEWIVLFLVTLPLEIVRFKLLYLRSIWEVEAPAELSRHGSAGESPASPARPMNLQVPKPDDLPGRVERSEGRAKC